MTKLAKQYYYSASNEKKINCYHINLSKEIVKKANIDDDDELIVYNDCDSIVIRKKYYCTCMECGFEWESGKEYNIQSYCPRCKVGDIHYDINGGNNDNQKQRAEEDA